MIPQRIQIYFLLRRIRIESVNAYLEYWKIWWFGKTPIIQMCLIKQKKNSLSLSLSLSLSSVKILDPFCGGGAIPLEATRLGLSAIGGDLNPVAVLISKAMVEIPALFRDFNPINPEIRKSALTTWSGAQGLAEDVRYYGELIRKKAWERIGYLYPKVQLSQEEDGSEATVIAWFWARTVQSPDPSWNGHVPLIRSGILRDKSGKPKVWVEPLVDIDSQVVTYRVREDDYKEYNTISRNGGRCIATESTIKLDYIKEQGKKGLLSKALIGVVAEGNKKRIYVNPTSLPDVPDPDWIPEGKFEGKSTNVTSYGMEHISDIFTDRQLIALTTFSDLLKDVRKIIEKDAIDVGFINNGVRLREGGSGKTAYVDAIITYLAFAIDKCADYWSTLGNWQNHKESLGPVFARQAIPMTWDFVEANPFSNSSGSWLGLLEGICNSLANLPAKEQGIILQRNAKSIISEIERPIICTDPPYYDNIYYADLSDYFYVWLRHNLSEVWPKECSTLMTPKRDEIVANAFRAGSKDKAHQHFEREMSKVMKEIGQFQNPDFPATIFYAFKQQDNQEGEKVSVGWEPFLQGLVDAGLMVTATWPISTEKPGGSRSRKAMLSSSVVIVCRSRPANAPMVTRGRFIAALQEELPDSIRRLQEQYQKDNIASVDMAQSAIGPGMQVFSRYSKVVETDGSVMPVRAALIVINDVLGEIFSEEGSELDAESRFALTWYGEYEYEPGPYGKADTLARAKVTSVDSLVKSGIAESQDGQVRLLRREDLEKDWEPEKDERRTDWKAVQHLIRVLDIREIKAAGLIWQLGGVADRALQLAHLLYAVCEEKGWSEEAVAYNGLVTVWPELVRLSRTTAARQRKTL